MKTDSNQFKRWILPKPTKKENIQNCKINHTLQKVLERRGINLKKNFRVQKDDLLNFDKIIVATGVKPRESKIPGSELAENVFNYQEFRSFYETWK